MIHVVGCVGAGKSYCIQNTWPFFETFDAKDIYEFDHFSPLDLQHLDQYTQHVATLEVKFEEYIHWCREIRQPIGIVESSGINQKLNLLLQLHSVLTIWIIPNLDRIQTISLLQNRFYAKKINGLILKQKANGIFIPHIQFNGETGEFIGPIPAEFRRFFPKNKLSNEKSLVCPKFVYNCPTCNADFSKSEYLFLHFQRFPQCQK